MRKMSRRFWFATLWLGFWGLVTGGCKTQSGAKEYIPGKGWRPVK